jgi:hypothetical protein
VLQEGLHALLAGASGVQAIVGTPQNRTDGTDGIFPATMPKNAPLPGMVYARIAGHEIDSMDGRGELRVSRIQISAFSGIYADVATLIEAAKDAIIGFHGQLSEGTEVDAAFLVLEQDAFEAVPKIFHSLFDVEVWFRNAAS